MQLPINASLARRNASKCKQSFQLWNSRYLAKRETHLSKSTFPPIKQHSANNPKRHDPKLASVFFALNESTNQLTSSSKLNKKIDINYINTTTHKMPTKKRITRVSFNDASPSANPSSLTATSSRFAIRQQIPRMQITLRINRQLPQPQLVLQISEQF